MDNKTQILIVDDHPLFRRGVVQLLAMEPELEVAGEARDGEEAVARAKELDPDLILLDLNMRGIGGLEALRRLRAEGVDARIVMLTVSDSDEDVVAALRAGADGYLLKDMEPEQLLERVKQAAVGKMVLSDQLTSVLATALAGPRTAGADELASLTGREMDILRCLARGLSNKMIARELDISEGTVKVHVKNLLKKLGLRSRVEAAVWAVNHQVE
jgi:two-component system, NarL family, nitrate/nitrite response regulator NarL